MVANLTSKLIFKLLLTSAILLLTGACSFKKDPYKAGYSGTLKISEKSNLSIEDQVFLENEEIGLENLQNLKIQGINEIKTSDGSLLDKAIKLERLKTVRSLIMRGHSPFNITNVSQMTIKSNPDFEVFFKMIQEDFFGELLKVYAETGSQRKSGQNQIGLQEFGQRILDYKMGSYGCTSFADFLMRSKYSSARDSDLATKPAVTFYKKPVAEKANFGLVVKDLLLSTHCSEFAKSIPLEKISSWVEREILVQFYRDFESRGFLDFLDSISVSSDVSINLTNSYFGNLPRQVAVSPLVILKSKRNCFSSKAEYVEWFSLLSKYSRGTYSFQYSSKLLDGETCANSSCYEEVETDFGDLGVNFVQSTLIAGRALTIVETLSKDKLCRSEIAIASAHNETSKLNE